MCVCGGVCACVCVGTESEGEEEMQRKKEKEKKKGHAAFVERTVGTISAKLKRYVNLCVHVFVGRRMRVSVML